MTLSKYQCPRCHASDWRTYTSFWQCEPCGHQYPCTGGIPRLYVEKEVDQRDRALRDYFYNGLLGRFYRQMMPFLALPVRPGYWRGWLTYWLIIVALLGLIGLIGYRIVSLVQGNPILPAIDLPTLLVAVILITFFARHRYLLWLLLLSVPTWLSLRSTKFRATTSFAEVHRHFIDELAARGEKLQVLDISTGTCNSLYRHGWMELDAEYTGLDLSETMLLQGRDFMAERRVPMDFVLGDAMQLPFAPDSFDVVLNYGALNGYGDTGRALAEMARVAKPGGLILILDEQLYPQATAIEHLYFHKVLSSHDIHDRFPVELLPPALTDVEVRQIYHFYYLFTARKPKARRGGSRVRKADAMATSSPQSSER